VVNWIPVTDSQRIVAMAYDADREAICVRFPNGVEWCYEACLASQWEEFSRPGTSRGRYIREVLDHKPHHRL